MFRPRSLVVGVFVLSLGAASLHAGDLRIPLPKKSKYTPVQKLNRDGVTAVQKHQYDKAKKLFYKAYLIDPNDPFTLNNLGYLAEIEGDSDRARRFYQLASEQSSDAVVDMASNYRVEGKPVSTVAGNAEEKGIQINRLNNDAMALLSRDRAPEADLLLQKALAIDPHNPFTLNNLGFAKEKEGEFDAAYQFYTAAANTNSRERVEMAIDRDWRGQEISEVAGENARKLNRRLNNINDIDTRVALLNLRGVSAFNRNERQKARDFIQQAYKLDPDDAFTLNNMGFLAEMEGDRETADYYYLRARDANRSNARITLATRKNVQGSKIGDLAQKTDTLVLSRMEAQQVARQQVGGPVLLRRRDNTAVMEPPQPLHPPAQYRESDENGDLVLPPLTNVDSSSPVRSGGGLAMPLPENQQPVTVHQGDNDNGIIMPLPDDQQPGTQQQPQPPQQQNPPQGEVDHGLIMPLPDNQQPGNQQTPKPQQQQNTPQPKQGAIDNGLMMPLPDNQQPGAKPPQPPAQAVPAQQNPGILLPPPDQPQQNQSQKPQTQQNGNLGNYSRPPANNGSGSTRTVPRPPKKITDAPSSNSPSNPDAQKPEENKSGPKKITDQD